MSIGIASVVSLIRRGLLVVLLALSACGDNDNTPIVTDSKTSLGAEKGGMQGLASDYRLGPNDRTRIIVFGQASLTGEYMLDGSGTLAFPLIGNIEARGMTPSQLQHAIAAKLDPDFLHNPSVSVEVSSRRPFYVVGEVQKPGPYPYVTDMNVLEAIATAGGQTYRANMGTFYIKRLVDGRTVRIAANQETVVQPGDTVQIRERFF